MNVVVPYVFDLFFAKRFRRRNINYLLWHSIRIICFWRSASHIPLSYKPEYDPISFPIYFDLYPQMGVFEFELAFDLVRNTI